MNDKADELHAMGIAAYQSGDMDLAEKYIRAAEEFDPKNASIHINLANVLMAKARYAAALISLSKANVLDSTLGIAHYLKAVVFTEMGDRDAALQSVNVALNLDPHSVKALLLRGNLLIESGDTESAIKDYKKAIALDEKDPLAHFNFACALQSMGQLVQALHEYDAALAIFSDFPEALCNKANALRDLMRLEEAHNFYRLAIEHAPTNANLRWNLGLLQLQLGDYAQGWKNYEYRLEEATHPQIKTSAMRWDGTHNLNAKSILVIAEQGLGDMLQFSRYLALLYQLGARITVQVPNSLLELLQNMEGVSTISISETPPETDFYCMLMSLPFLFQTQLDTIPYSSSAYLRSTPSCLKKWESILGARHGPRIGLVTRGNPRNPRDVKRSIQLETLMSFIPSHLGCYMLHEDLHSNEAQTLAKYPNIIPLHENIQTFDDTAAACLQMDLVITVDTAVAHLSGGLGVETWVLIPFASDWRWLLHRTDSPWYPKMRLFRQRASESWPEVVQRVARALTAKIGS